jgi:hypothetical protein
MSQAVNASATAVEEMIETEENDHGQDGEDEQDLAEAGLDEDNEAQPRPDQPEGNQDGKGQQNRTGMTGHDRFRKG